MGVALMLGGTVLALTMSLMLWAAFMEEDLNDVDDWPDDLDME